MKFGANDGPGGPLPEPDLTSTPLSVWPSEVPHGQHRAAARFDPFWQGMTVGALTASWESRALVERLASAGIRPVTVRDLRHDPDFSARWVRDRSRPAVDSLAAIAMWRTSTTDQLAAFAGWVDPARPTGSDAVRWSRIPSLVRRLWAAGLVERGKMTSHQTGLPVLWRPVKNHRVESFVNDLDYEDWLRVTAGVPWAASPPGDLHNVICSELGLRLAEFTDVATVLGESLCSVQMMQPGASQAVAGSASGDLAAVREDGLRIVFEMTVHQSKLSIRRKVERWCDLLASEDYAKSGLSVCFVEAMPPDSSGSKVLSALRSEIVRALSQRPDAAFHRLRERISLARWRWWFPAPLEAAEGFSTLHAFRPTGSGDSVWQPVHLLDVSDMVFDPVDPDGLAAVVSNSRFFGGVPYWVRDRLVEQFGAADFGSLVTERAGLSDVAGVFGGAGGGVGGDAEGCA